MLATGAYDFSQMFCAGRMIVIGTISFVAVSVSNKLVVQIDIVIAIPYPLRSIPI